MLLAVHLITKEGQKTDQQHSIWTDLDEHKSCKSYYVYRDRLKTMLVPALEATLKREGADSRSSIQEHQTPVLLLFTVLSAIVSTEEVTFYCEGFSILPLNLGSEGIIQGLFRLPVFKEKPPANFISTLRQTNPMSLLKMITDSTSLLPSPTQEYSLLLRVNVSGLEVAPCD